MNNDTSFYITVTVDWEGEHFNNIDDTVYVRNALGDNIPVTHFMCPAYFTGKSRRTAVKMMKPAIKQNDEVGLHLHCFRSLIEAVHIPFRTEMNYANASDMESFVSLFSKKHSKSMITGRGVPLSVYNPSEILEIVKFSRELVCSELELDELGGFRSGGWMANNSVYEALQTLGFIYDSSSVPPEILSCGYTEQNNGTLRDEYGDRNGVFTDFILQLWGFQEQDKYFLQNCLFKSFCPTSSITPTSQPFFINKLVELPNNCAMIDFASAEKTMQRILNQGLNHKNTTSGDSFFMNIGFHNEGSWDYKANLIEFIKNILPFDLPHIHFVSARQAAELYTQQYKSHKIMAS